MDLRSSLDTRTRSKRASSLLAKRVWSSLKSKNKEDDSCENDVDLIPIMDKENQSLVEPQNSAAKRYKISEGSKSPSIKLIDCDSETQHDVNVTNGSQKNSDGKKSLDSVSNSERKKFKEDNSDEEETLQDYMMIREQNLKANQEFLARIGMQKAKEDLESTVMKIRPLPSSRGLKQPKKQAEPLPRRSSMRLRRIDPEGVPLPEPEVVEEFVEQRLPETVSMKEIHYSKSQNNVENLNLKPFLSTITSLRHEQNIISPISSSSPENERLVVDIKKTKISGDQVAKVVPGRIYSVGWHPSKDRMIALAGDTNGYLGCWNVFAKDDDVDIVRAFRPHLKPLTHLFVPPKNGHKLYTSSYDATIRCGDFEKGVFDLVFSVPEEDDDLFRNFDFLGDNSSSMLVCHYRGLVSLVDSRSPSKTADQFFKVSQHPLRKLSVHPVSPHYFITAGRDPQIYLWDLRSMKSKSPKAVEILKGHSKTIASAYFDPTSGNQILSSSSDDSIQIFTKEGGKFQRSARIHHNNHTGRWLTPIQPSWHPTVEGIFVSGSMARPRQIEVFNSNGCLVTNLLGDHLASVCSINAFHPARRTAVVGANSSGRLHVFM